MQHEEDKYGRSASFTRKTSRPQLMRALSDFDDKRVRRRYVCLGLFLLGCVMASIIVYGIVRAATTPSPSAASTTTSPEEAAGEHHLTFAPSAIPPSAEPPPEHTSEESVKGEEDVHPSADTTPAPDDITTPPHKGHSHPSSSQETADGASVTSTEGSSHAD